MYIACTNANPTSHATFEPGARSIQSIRRSNQPAG